VADMKKMYIRSLSEVETNLIFANNNDIGDLILFDLDDDKFFYIRNESAPLEKSCDKISRISNKFTNNRFVSNTSKYIIDALNNSFEINEDFFKKCLKIKMNDIYKMSKNVFLTENNLSEWII
jgi:hypothetical protein